jgi:hypothetical protein
MPTDWENIFTPDPTPADISFSSVIPRYCQQGECEHLGMAEGDMRWVYIMVHTAVEHRFARAWPAFERYRIFDDFIEQAVGGPVPDPAAKSLYENALFKNGCPYLYVNQGPEKFFIRVECGFAQGIGDRSGDWFIKVYKSKEDADFLDRLTRTFSTCLPECGDSFCDPSESAKSCPVDCGAVSFLNARDPSPGCSGTWEISP